MKVILDGGQVIDLGETEATPTISLADYSRRETDDFGVTTVVERGFARRMSVKLIVPFGQADAVQRTLAGLRARAVQWVADENSKWLNFRGFYKDFEIDLNTPPISYCTLTVEGLVDAEPFTDPGTDPAPNGDASSLLLLQPATIAGNALVSSSVPEDDYPEWSAGTTYPVGARVIKASTHRIYESGGASNLGNDPSGVSGKWTDIGPTNRWAMFDQALGSVTTRASSIAVTLAPGPFNAVALLDVSGTSVRVQASGCDRTLAPNASGTVTFLDLPTTNGQVVVTASGSGSVSVGTLLVGKLVGLGSTTDSPKAGISDFSRKEADEFGEVTVVERAWAKRVSLTAMIRTDAIDVVAGRIAAVRATPSLWIGKDGLETITAYGFFKDFQIQRDTALSKLSLTIEGLSTAGKVEPLQAGVDWPDVGDPLGTKPQDNATVGAPAGTLVAGMPAEQVPAQFNFNADSLLGVFLTVDQLRTLVDTRTFVAGQPLATLFVDERQSRLDDKTASEANFNLLGAKGPDGSTWLLNTDGVITGIDPDTGLPVTMSQKLTQIGTDIGLSRGQIDFLLQTVVEGDGVLSKAVLRVTSGGAIAGFSATADGHEGELSWLADKFKLIDPNGGQPIVPFSYEDNRFKMSNLEVDTITFSAMAAQLGGENNQLSPAGGYQVMPGGLIMQWGQIRSAINDETTFPITFPMPFPNAVMSINATPYLSTYSTTRDLWLQNVGAPTKTGAVFGTQSSTSNSQKLDGFDWIAFGH